MARITSRIAPTPSGFLHVGNVYNFLLTELLVTRATGLLRLRIDDMDRSRIKAEYVQDIFETLNWLGLAWQSGPKDIADHLERYSQHLRISRYERLLQDLLASGRVFACTCSRQDVNAGSTDGQYSGTCRHKDLPLDTPNAAWRIRTPEHTVISFQDRIAGQAVFDLYHTTRDFIIRRRDGLPAYHVCSLADDMDFGVNLIVRGEDLLQSTAAQVYLASLVGNPAFAATQFYHHPLLSNTAGVKLSKSAGSLSVRAMRAQGISAEEVRGNFMAWAEGINTM